MTDSRHGAQPDNQNIGFIRFSMQALPEVKYAVGLAGIAACVALVRGFQPGVTIVSMLPIFGGSIVCMALLLLFVRAAKPNRGSSVAGMVLLWAVCIFVITFMGFTISSIAVGWPKPWARLILPERAANAPAASAIRGSVQDGTIGYSYYEVSKSGQMTNDGRITPLNNTAMPPFSAIAENTVFQAQDGVQVRANPPTNLTNASPHNSRIVTTLSQGQCVKVISGTRYTVAVGNAASGGWLPVTVTQC